MGVINMLTHKIKFNSKAVNKRLAKKAKKKIKRVAKDILKAVIDLSPVKGTTLIGGTGYIRTGLFKSAWSLHGNTLKNSAPYASYYEFGTRAWRGAFNIKKATKIVLNKHKKL